MVITGLTRKRLGLVTFIYPQTLETLHFFGILSAEISEVGRQFSIKIPNQNLIRRDIEVVITGLTRNQFVRKHTRVRIPLSPPKSKKHPLLRMLSCFLREYKQDSSMRTSQPCPIAFSRSSLRAPVTPISACAVHRTATAPRRYPITRDGLNSEVYHKCDTMEIAAE